MEEAIFAEACEALQVDCSGLLAPLVIDSLIAPATGNFGFTYPGEDYIFVDPGLSEESLPRRSDVVFHETVHYVLEAVAPETSACDSERTARILTAVRIGIDYDPSWEDWYGCN